MIFKGSLSLESIHCILNMITACYFFFRGGGGGGGGGGEGGGWLCTFVILFFS